MDFTSFPAVVRMSLMNLCNELLNIQQETMTSISELLEKEISKNSQWAPSIVEQSSSDLPKLILGQAEELAEKEKQNASKLQELEELQRDAMEIAEEHHHRLEEVRLNLTTTLTSKAEHYGGTSPKTISRAKSTPLVPNTLPQRAMAPIYSGHLTLRWDPLLEDDAALLRDEVLNGIPGTINMQCGTASQSRVKTWHEYECRLDA